MSLVQYSDSDSDPEPQSNPSPPSSKKTHPNPTTPSLPPLPESFHDLYATATRVSVQDDPNLHDGRVRIIPHIEGNWPTHVYLQWYPCVEGQGLLYNTLVQCGIDISDRSENQVHSLLISDLGVKLPLHISLSRSVVVRTEQRFELTDALENAIKESGVLSFYIQPDRLYWSSNYEKTRWFLVLGVQKPKNDELNRLLKVTNDVLARFGQPPLYAAPLAQGQQSSSSPRGPDGSLVEDFSECFHISLAWSLSEPSAKDRERIDAINLGALREKRVGFDVVRVKIGNTRTYIPLNTRW
ncbi:uncharacterized protein N7515_008354 [Penicillium bovifimosum]|uniref:U6 snRNA phosphodiesterase n=1 Tax=Penicillium bovifimosum TaxID=126998 RepID=A0A9W9GN97_9EURO|nr:uncharacterized protein N7515_008354 [Penicillium bovifimosum]KAJ5124529.1 hypothetical protein N7515_008354 [Penicillium bovifimosum]